MPRRCRGRSAPRGSRPSRSGCRRGDAHALSPSVDRSVGMLHLGAAAGRARASAVSSSMVMPDACRLSSVSRAPHSRPRQKEVGQRACGGRLVQDAALGPGRVAVQAVGGTGEAVAVEGVRRGVPRGQLGRMQVPALVEAALQGPAYQAQVQRPAAAYLLGVADREDVGRAVGETYAGARRGGLHHGLGVVGDRVLHRLVGRRDPAERGVVVGAVVEPDDAGGRGVQHPRDQGRAVGSEDRLRRLHLDLEAQRAGREPVRRLESAHRPGHRVDLADRGHLRQRDDEAVEVASGREQVVDEPDERARARGASSAARSS